MARHTGDNYEEVFGLARDLTACLKWYVQMFAPGDHLVGHAGHDCMHCATREVLARAGASTSTTPSE